MAITQITQRDTQLEKQRLGFNGVSLTNIDNFNAPSIASGSVVELSGSIYSITSDESITGTASAGINYIYLLSDGSAFEYSSTEPTWSNAKCGWYNVTNDRCVASFALDGSDYREKYIVYGVDAFTQKRYIQYTGTTGSSDGEFSINIDLTYYDSYGADVSIAPASPSNAFIFNPGSIGYFTVSKIIVISPGNATYNSQPYNLTIWYALK